MKLKVEFKAFDIVSDCDLKDKNCCKHLNQIIQDYSQKNGPTILMIDEVLPMTGSSEEILGETVTYDWSSLKMSDKVDVVMALSPAPTYWRGLGKHFKIVPPPNMYSQQLLHKYRNFAQLDKLLSCIKCHQNDLSSE